MAMSNKQWAAVVVVVVVIVAVVAVAVVYSGDDDEDDDDSTTEAYYTMTTFIDYNGNTAELSFYEEPERIVAGCSTALNLLLYLGLGDKIVGVYYNEEPVWSEVEDEYEELVERIGEVDGDESYNRNLSGNISTDVLASWEPDLVIGWVSWTDSGLGSEEFWNDLGCNVMSFNTMTTDDYANLDAMKTDYDNIGNIFNIKDQTDALYDEIVGVFDAIDEAMEGNDTLVYAIIDNADDPADGTIWAYDDTNFLAGVLNDMGLTNAFPDGGTMSVATVYEVIGTTDIDLIIYIAYGEVTYEDSLQSWLDDPDLAACSAIQEGHTLSMKLSCSYGTCPELLDVVQQLYEYIMEIYDES